MLRRETERGRGNLARVSLLVAFLLLGSCADEVSDGLSGGPLPDSVRAALVKTLNDSYHARLAINHDRRHATDIVHRAEGRARVVVEGEPKVEFVLIGPTLYRSSPSDVRRYEREEFASHARGRAAIDPSFQWLRSLLDGRGVTFTTEGDALQAEAGIFDREAVTGALTYTPDDRVESIDLRYETGSQVMTFKYTEVPLIKAPPTSRVVDASVSATCGPDGFPPDGRFFCSKSR